MAIFYLAGRVSRKEELFKVALDLSVAGHRTSCSWLDRPGDHANHVITDRSERASIAAQDLHDIRVADIFVLFSEEKGNGSSGGRLVELGYALGRHKECWVVGPAENLFMCLANIRLYQDWEEALRDVYALTQVQEEAKQAAIRPIPTSSTGNTPST